MGRLLTERHGALLASLAADEDGLLLEVDVGKCEVDRLLGAEAGRIDELEKRSVPKRERIVALERFEKRVRLFRPWSVRKPAATPSREGEVGNATRTERRPDQRPHRRHLSRQRGLGQLPGRPAGAIRSELGGVFGEGTGVERFEVEAACLEPVARR